MTAPENISGRVEGEDMPLQSNYILSFCFDVFLIVLLVNVDWLFLM